MYVALDPGPTPGFAQYDPEQGAFKAWIEDDWWCGAARIRHLFENGPPSVLVVERFSIGGARRKSSNETIEMIGMARYFAKDYGVPFVEQSPADAAQFSTPAKLKAIGWYTPGAADHARSATGHLLLYLARARLIDLSQLL